MKFIVVFGPPAVGKMTVGYELAKLTGFRLFHNHMTIELVLNFFDYEQPQFHALVAEFRKRIFEEVAASDLTGLIFTFVWALELESEKTYIERICGIFREKGADVYFVELEAELPERLKRNENEFRLLQKPSKRNVEQSRNHLLDSNEKYKLNSDGDFFYKENYLKVNNTNLSADETARRIIDEFGFNAVDVITHS
jgi:shikimate kinase